MAHEKQLCLSERLKTLADLVPSGSRLADIGTDHAYLPLWLLQQGHIVFAAACDVHEGPLQRAGALATGPCHSGWETAWPALPPARLM